MQGKSEQNLKYCNNIWIIRLISIYGFDGEVEKLYKNKHSEFPRRTNLFLFLFLIWKPNLKSVLMISDIKYL